MARSDLSAWPALEGAAKSRAMLDHSDEPVLETLELPEREHGVRSIVGEIGSGLVLQIGQSLEDDDEFIAAFLNGFLITLAGVILLGGPTGWFMARRALRGVQEVTRTAEDIAAGALDRRVTVTSRGDELDRLARTFNTMLDRIQALIVGMREMTDNLAHDLRSPLARMRAAADMSVSDTETEAQLNALAESTTEECDRLLEIINATLDIAEAESGAARLNIAKMPIQLAPNAVCRLSRG
jgi:signal transduction histidine kinase